ncbi:MAG: 3-methyl-2-oxobutanoate hydroxymethyltransferase, partial [Gammaproteobacteria bacterium]
MKKTVSASFLSERKQRKEKLACLTAYDASFARILEEEGIDVVLVGDSLGMVLQGESDTLSVSMEDMIYHTRLVSRGLEHTLLIADMPCGSYDTPELALNNGLRLIREGGADMVKLEGGREILDQLALLRDNGIAVCGHLGLQPQSVHKYGGYKVQGRDKQQADRIFEDALRLEQAGVGMIVLECIPRQLAARITAAVSIPVTGIGAGINCDGQILVLYDVIGVSAYIPKMANDFLQQGGSIRG